MNPEWTGERLETHIFNETAIEHLHRYALAREFVQHKKVLDIACGEGYGSNLLSQSAASVTGVDIDTTTIEKAKTKYTAGNLEFLPGNIGQIPSPDHAFDVVVSFETLEHLAEHEKMMKEIRRVLKPGGLLILSTPDRQFHADENETKSKFHVKELYLEEFQKLVKSFFNYYLFCHQQSSYTSVIVPDEAEGELKFYEGDFLKIEPKHSIKPFFHIVFASDNPLQPLPASVFNSSWSFPQLLKAREELVTNSISYKTGRLLLSPLRFLRSLFKKQ